MDRTLKGIKTQNNVSSVRYFQDLNPWMIVVLVVVNVLFQLSESVSPVFKYAGICVLFAMLFFLDKDDYIYFSVSLMSVISFATVFTVSVINVITVVYFIRAYIYDNKYMPKKEKRKFPSQIIIVCVVWIMYCVQYFFEGTDGLKAVIVVVKQLLFLVYMVDVFRVCKSRKEVRKKLFTMEIYYVLGIIISSIISVVMNGNQSLHNTRLMLNSVTGANRYGLLLAFSMIFILLEFLNVKNVKEWIVLAVAAGIVLYFCFAVKSRNCMITVALSFVATVFYGISKPKSRLSAIILLVSAVSLFVLIVTVGKNARIYDNIMGTIHRFVNPSGEDITNGRTDLWVDYLKAFTSDIRFFLLGSSNRDNFADKEAHNIYLDILTQYGIIGFFIVSVVYTMVFIEISKVVKSFGKVKSDLISFLPFFMVFFMGIASSLSLLTTNPTINFCMGVAMIYSYQIDDDSNAEEEKVIDEKKTRVSLRRKLRM